MAQNSDSTCVDPENAKNSEDSKTLSDAEIEEASLAGLKSVQFDI